MSPAGAAFLGSFLSRVSRLSPRPVCVPLTLGADSGLMAKLPGILLGDGNPDGVFGGRNPLVPLGCFLVRIFPASQKHVVLSWRRGWADRGRFDPRSVRDVPRGQAHVAEDDARADKHAGAHSDHDCDRRVHRGAPTPHPCLQRCPSLGSPLAPSHLHAAHFFLLTVSWSEGNSSSRSVWRHTRPW
jgi:hypothetical protein